MTEPQPAGADLARQMLRQARADAAKRGTQPAKERRTKRRHTRGDGRDPARIEDVLDALATAYGWKRMSAGGRVMVAWPRLLGDDAARISPVRYDEATRTLHVRPVSNAAATWARWETPRILQRLNSEMAGAVAALRILTPGPASTSGLDAEEFSAENRSPSAPSEAPRMETPAAFHDAIAAAQAARTEHAVDPDQPLRDRYFADTRGALREPTEAFTDGQAALEGSRGDDPEEIRQAAIRMARDAKAGRLPAVPRLFDRTA